MNALPVTTLRLWTPLVLAALGGVVAERAGVAQIGLEGILLTGAFVAVASAAASGSLMVGALCALMIGAACGLLHAFLTQTLRVHAILSGLGINLVAVGTTTFVLRLCGDAGLETRATLPAETMILVAVASVGVVWFILTRTVVGLRLRACGERPGAVTEAGVAVLRIRYGALAAGGALTGLGGAALSLVGLGTFTENMSAGRGFLALAAVILGRWSAPGAAAAALLFALGDAGQVALQTAGFARMAPPALVQLLPYLIALATLGLGGGRAAAPAALNETEPIA